MFYKKGMVKIKMVPRGGIEPPTQGFSVLCSTDWATEATWRSGRDLNPRSPVWQTSMLTTTPPDQFWLREKDLNQRPPGYEPGELPDCSIPRYRWRRKRDLDPRGPSDPYRFSRPNPSATWVFLRVLRFYGGPDRTRTCDQPVMSR